MLVPIFPAVNVCGDRSRAKTLLILALIRCHSSLSLSGSKLYLSSIIHSTFFCFLPTTLLSSSDSLLSLPIHELTYILHHVSRRRHPPIGISYALPASPSVRCCSPDHSRFPAGNSHEELFEKFAVYVPLCSIIWNKILGIIMLIVDSS
jgi:hypothetical protein